LEIPLFSMILYIFTKWQIILHYVDKKILTINNLLILTTPNYCILLAEYLNQKLQHEAKRDQQVLDMFGFERKGINYPWKCK